MSTAIVDKTDPQHFQPFNNTDHSPNVSRMCWGESKLCREIHGLVTRRSELLVRNKRRLSKCDLQLALWEHRVRIGSGAFGEEYLLFADAGAK